MYKFIVDSGSDKGKRKDHSEDYYLVTNLGYDGLLVIVADGVSGLIAGDVASRLGSEFYSVELIKNLADYFKMGVPKSMSLDDDLFITNAIQQSIRAANANSRKLIKGAGTTLVSALILNNGTMYVVNIGDSRAYIINGTEIHQITRDHSVAWDSFEEEKKNYAANKSNYEEWLKNYSEFKRNFIMSHPRSHVIKNVLGYYGDIDYMDIFKLKIANGDKVLLATDGLTDLVNDYEIMKILKNNGDVSKLINSANDKGGHDNITAVLVNVVESDKKEADQG